MSERTERAVSNAQQDREVCTQCTASIDTSDWYPIATERDDESVTLHPFCDEACKAAWLDGENT